MRVQMEKVNGLTPCISKPGAGRRGKGRRVTICPGENIEHEIDQLDAQEHNKSKKSRFSSDLSGTGMFIFLYSS